MLEIPRAFDNSMLKEYCVCPRRFFWSHVANWKPVRANHAADFGSVLHEGLAEWYSTFDESRALAVLKSAWGKYFLPEQPIDTFLPPPTVPELYALHRAEAILSAYITLRGLEYQGSVTLVEGGFAHPLPGQHDFYYTGKIDLVIDTPAGTTILDHKSTKSFGPTTPSTVYPNPQLTGYAWSLSHYTPGPILAGLNWLIIRKTGTEFARSTLIQHTQWDTQEWLKSTLTLIKGIVECGARSYWPQHTALCHQFYGACPYIPLCAMRCNPIEAYNRGPGGTYRVEMWEPFENARS